MADRANAIALAKENVRDAVRHLIEARHELTLGEIEAFVREEYPANGNGGFVASTCEAMVRGATAQVGDTNVRPLAGPEARK